MARRSQEPNYGFPPARGGRGAPSMFPRKLFQILCETDPAVVGWDSDGKSFHIANFEEFIEGVMPLFYRHNKLTSFQRQLNLYGEFSEEERRTLPLPCTPTDGISIASIVGALALCLLATRQPVDGRAGGCTASRHSNRESWNALA